MDSPENFQRRIKTKINQVEAKLSYLKEGQGQLMNAFHEFAEEMDGYQEYQLKTNQKMLDQLTPNN